MIISHGHVIVNSSLLTICEFFIFIKWVFPLYETEKMVYNGKDYYNRRRMRVKCTKCGRELQTEGVFCEKCLKDMERYPVKPGTVIQLPQRKPAASKKAPRKKILSQEEQLAQQRRTIRFLRLSLVCTLLLLTLAVIFLVHLSGQSSI